MLLSGIWTKGILKRSSFRAVALSTNINGVITVTMEDSLLKRNKKVESSSGIPELNLQIRNPQHNGSRQSRWLRRNGRVPGVLYGVDEQKKVLKTSVIIDQKVLLKELRDKGKSFENTLYELALHAPEEENTEAVKETTGESTVAMGKTTSSSSSKAVSKHLAIARQTQFDPITDLPVSVNWLRYYPGVKMRIPFSYYNEDKSTELKRGGSYLMTINRWVECVCDDEIPQSIPVDLSMVDARNPVIRLSQVHLPPRVRPHKSVSRDYVIGVLKFGRRG